MPNRYQSCFGTKSSSTVIWINFGLLYWHIYASMGLYLLRELLDGLGQLQCGPVITRSISSKSSQQTLHSSPLRAKYEVTFLNLKSDLYVALVNAVVCEISYYAGTRYSHTRLKLVSSFIYLFIYTSASIIIYIYIYSCIFWAFIFPVGIHRFVCNCWLHNKMKSSNLYEATSELCSLSRQVVFYGMAYL